MSVTSVDLHSQGSSGGVEGSDGGTVKASYTAMWRVKCSSAADSIDDVLFHFRTTPSLPWMGRRFKFGNGFNASVICKALKADYIEKSGGVFIASATFESPGAQSQGGQGTDLGGQGSTNPFDWHDEINISFYSISQPCEKAVLKFVEPLGIQNPRLPIGYTGPIQNSVPQPYDPTVEEEIKIKVVRITKHLPKYDAAFFDSYLDCINSDTFTINKPEYGFRQSVGIYRAKFGTVDASFGVSSGIKYWRVTAEVLLNPSPYGWLRPVVDRGRDRDQSPGAKNDQGVTISPGDDAVTRGQLTKPILSSDGYPVADPVNLDGNGQALKHGKKPVVHIWQTKPLKPFAGIQW